MEEKTDIKLPLKLLAVEDDYEERVLLARTLQHLGYVEYPESESSPVLKKPSPDYFMLAENGATGFEQFKAYSPSIILLDVGLPDISGVELLENMKELNAQCRILMVTGDHYKDTIDQCIRNGVDGYITKPFSPGVLSAYLRKVSG